MKPSLRDIQTATCDVLAISHADLIGRYPQTLEFVHKRWIGMFLSREMSGFSFPAIGAGFNRHHSTILSCCLRMKDLLDDPRVLARVLQVSAAATATSRSRTAQERHFAHSLHIVPRTPNRRPAPFVLSVSPSRNLLVPAIPRTRITVKHNSYGLASSGD